MRAGAVVIRRFLTSRFCYFISFLTPCVHSVGFNPVKHTWHLCTVQNDFMLPPSSPYACSTISPRHHDRAWGGKPTSWSLECGQWIVNLLPLTNESPCCFVRSAFTFCRCGSVSHLLPSTSMLLLIPATCLLP